MKNLLGQDQLALTGQTQTVFVTAVFYDDLARLAQQFCAGEPVAGFSTLLRCGFQMLAGSHRGRRMF